MDNLNYKGFLLFIGYGRSGHSVVVNVLNKHPNILISDEVGILKEVNNPKERIIKKTMNKANIRPPRYSSLNKNIKFKDEVPEKEKIHYIGDKHANQTTKYINNNFELLNKFEKKMKNLKLIHVIRNPYDIITTKFLRRKSERWKGKIKNTINEFNLLSNTVDTIKKSYSVYDIYLENLIYEPVRNISRIFDNLNLEYNDELVYNMSDVLLKEPNISRYKIDWSERNKEMVKKIINKHNFLDGYEFD